MRRKAPPLAKCGTQVNPADLLTKGLGRDRIQELLQLMFIQAQGGRADVAPIRSDTCPRFGPTEFDDPDSDIEAAVAALALIMSKLRVSDDMIGDF